MPIKFRAIPEHNLIILIHTGAVPDDEFLTFYESLYESDSFNPEANQLVDLRDADSMARSTEVLLRFAHIVRKKLTGLTTPPKVAVVAPKDLSFSLAQMYGAFAKSVPWEFVVFRAPDAALAWLAVPEDVLLDEETP